MVGRGLLSSTVLVLAIAVIVPLPAQAKKKFKKPQNVAVECTGEKVEASWDKNNKAKKYRVVIYKGSSKVFKKSSTKLRKKKLKVSNFDEGKTYRYRIRIVKTSERKKSKWAKKKYVHYAANCQEDTPEEVAEETGEDPALDLEPIDETAAPRAAVWGDLSSTNSAGRSGAYYLPTGYNTRHSPVMVAFHGTGGDGDEIVSFFDEYAEEHGFIIIAPSSRVSPSGQYIWEVGTAEGEVTEDLTHAQNAMAEVFAKDGVYEDLRATLSTGFSAGGSMSAYLATNDNRFTHFGVLHGGIFSGGFGENVPEAWLSTGTTDTLRTVSELELYESTLNSLGFETVFKQYAVGHTIPDVEKQELMTWWLE